MGSLLLDIIFYLQWAQFIIFKVFLLLELPPRHNLYIFIGTQTPKTISKIKEGESFSTWNQVIYSKQEIPRKFKFWTLHFFISIEIKVNIKRYVKISQLNFLGQLCMKKCDKLLFIIFKTPSASRVSEHNSKYFSILKFHLVIALFYIIYYVLHIFLTVNDKKAYHDMWCRICYCSTTTAVACCQGT